MSVNLRNIAIIAHVDHGKTTLVDHILRQSGTFQVHEQIDERFMDSMDLEKERGITIAAKNASYVYKDIRVNIVDTPGHSDFGGEVERILDMVDGAILLVDASEGPLPQTRFVLSKALKRGMKILVCINKIDRPDSRISEVLNEIFDLFIELDASEEQADFDVIYTIAKEGKSTLDPKVAPDDFHLLLDMINDKFPSPDADPNAPLQILVSNLDHSPFVGHLAVGRIHAGSLKVGDELSLMQEAGLKKFRVSALFAYDRSEPKPTDSLSAGNIAIVAGMTNPEIGDTIGPVESPVALPRIMVEEPTVGIFMSVNDSPFAGLDGKQVTSRKIKDRLDKELLHNVALRILPTDTSDTFKVLGRGELQLAILIEQMRREGFEVCVSQPKVIYKTNEAGGKTEPMEKATIDVEDQYSGVVTQKLGSRKGILMHMDNKGSGRIRMEFHIPSRGLIGYRSEFLTDTRGTGLLSTEFLGYQDFKGDFESRITGAIIADRKGKATGYALDSLNDRGRLFITPGVEVYQGMVVGEANKGIDLNVNVTKEKKLTNVRASGTDDAVKLAPVKPMTLEEAMEWISDFELIEVTPKFIRIRCVNLDPHKRKR